MLIRLACDHIANYDPAPRKLDLLLCYRCNDYREFIEIVRPEIMFRLRCTSCRYPRKFGNNEQEAFRAAVKHINVHPTHKVRITRNGVLVKEISDLTEPIPGMPAVQAWLEANPQHQASLRALTLTKQANQTSCP